MQPQRCTWRPSVVGVVEYRCCWARVFEAVGRSGCWSRSSLVSTVTASSTPWNEALHHIFISSDSTWQLGLPNKRTLWGRLSSRTRLSSHGPITRVCPRSVPARIPARQRKVSRTFLNDDDVADNLLLLVIRDGNSKVERSAEDGGRRCHTYSLQKR